MITQQESEVLFKCAADTDLLDWILFSMLLQREHEIRLGDEDVRFSHQNTEFLPSTWNTTSHRQQS